MSDSETFRQICTPILQNSISDCFECI